LRQLQRRWFPRPWRRDGHRSQHKPQPLRSHRLELERLEDRTLLSVALQSSYTGIGFAQQRSLSGFNAEPPDTQGAAGPSSVIETVNLAISIFTPKDTGAAGVTDSNADFFFTQGGLSHAAPMDAQSDPFTIYDPLVQRFIVGEIDFQVDSNGAPVNNGGNVLLLAVSKINNPATLTKADWFFYEINTAEPGVAILDYPGNPGYNADALVVTLDPFDSSGTELTHDQVNAISMNALINGTPLTRNSNYFQTDNSRNRGLLLRPTTMQDSSPGDPMWLVDENGTNTSIDVIRMDNVLSSSPTFTTTTLTVTPYVRAVVGINPDGTPTDTVADSRILKAAEQNGLLVASQEVAVAGGNGDMARWYEINVSSGTPVLQQEGDVGGGPVTIEFTSIHVVPNLLALNQTETITVHVFGTSVYDRYPAIDINAQGDIGMTFIQSRFGTLGEFESLYITGRTPSDAPGTMETPVLVQAGTANYVGAREGDMTGINVDADGSFWAFGQFANNDPSPNWGTAIGHFTLGAFEAQPAAGGVVNVGTVTFTLDGHSVSASVDANGNATASLTLPLLKAAFPQSITAAFSGPDSSSGSATVTAFWNVLNALVPGVDTFATDGSQSVQSFLLGLPLLDFLYTSSGQLTKVVFGPNLLSWDFSYFANGLTVVTLDGVLPIALIARTPQGQFLGAVQITVSADGGLVVESINPQGQVVSAQPV
jgi:hypothetical protein